MKGNNGIRSSTGDSVSFLDSDDEYLPHKLEVLVPVLEINPNIGMVLSGWLDVDNIGIVLLNRQFIITNLPYWSV